MNRATCTVLILLSIGVGPTGAGAASMPSDAPQEPAAARPRSTEGHRRMLALLDAVRAQARQQHAFAGDAEARSLRSQIGALPEEAPRKRFRLGRQLAYHELKLGNTRAAIEALTMARAQLPALSGKLAKPAIRAATLELAVAWLRLGQERNDVEKHAGESCILPLRGAGVHEDREGSLEAIPLLREVLSIQPEDPAARWLLNLAYMTLGRYPQGVPAEERIPPKDFESAEAFPRFDNTALERGLVRFEPGGGCIAEDFDGDGDLDLITSSCDPGAGLRYYQNDGGGAFAERSVEVGFTGLYGGHNLLQADYDNDGDADVLVLRGAWLGEGGRHPNSLLANLGGGTFADVTFEAGLGEVHHPTQAAAWADYDNDGDLDLYVGNQAAEGLEAPCQLFRNDGQGRFEDAAPAAGVTNDRNAMAVHFGDFDGDRLPDLYVSNQGAPNRLYRNQGDGTFDDVALAQRVFRPIDGSAAWFWDFDNDGVLDIFAGAWHVGLEPTAASWLGQPHATALASLYRGREGGGFDDVAGERGLDRVCLPMGGNFGDLDDDGFPELLLTTGYQGHDDLMPNRMYWNRAGETFVDVTMAAGFGHLRTSQGVSVADLDGDGDQDVFVRVGGLSPGSAFASAFFENPGLGGRWIDVELEGVRSNRSAIGARIRCEVEEDGQRRSIYRHVGSGGSFGASPLRQRIGLGRAEKALSLEVFWPTTGLSQVRRDLAAGQLVRIREGEDEGGG